jgi:RNA polymerase-binding transcription factor DksA
MDVGDRAQALSELHLKHELDAHQKNNGAVTAERVINGVIVCNDCADDIPIERITALHSGGIAALLCIDCQKLHEQKSKQGRG